MNTAHSNNLFWFGRGLLWLLTKIAFRWQILGSDRIPQSGGLIVYSNHASWWDIPLLGCSVPRRVRFMAKSELFRHPLVGPLLRAVGAFPVTRHTGDLKAIRQAITLLKAGEVLIIFPEGTRSRTGELKPAESGLAFLASKARVPVVPVGISSRYRFRQPAIVRFGPVISAAELLPEGSNKALLSAASKRLMDEVAVLLMPDHLRSGTIPLP